MYKRTSTRAAGVSPPWCVKPAPRGKNQAPIGDWRTQRATHVSPPWCVANTFARTQALLFGGPPTVDVRMPVAFALIVPTGGLRPPLLCCGANTCRRENDFCDVQTHVQESGGRQPAVGVSNAVAIANAFVQRCERQPAVVFRTASATGKSLSLNGRWLSLAHRGLQTVSATTMR